MVVPDNDEPSAAGAPSDAASKQDDGRFKRGPAIPVNHPQLDALLLTVCGLVSALDDRLLMMHLEDLMPWVLFSLQAKDPSVAVDSLFTFNVCCQAMHTHTHTHIHAYVHTCMHQHTHTHIYSFIHAYRSTYMHSNLSVLPNALQTVVLYPHPSLHYASRLHAQTSPIARCPPVMPLRRYCSATPCPPWKTTFTPWCPDCWSWPAA